MPEYGLPIKPCPLGAATRRCRIGGTSENQWVGPPPVHRYRRTVRASQTLAILNASEADQGVAATYNSATDEADKVVATVEEHGAKAFALKLDSGDVGTFDAFVDRVREAIGALGADRFDYLVNDAGMSDDARWVAGQRIEALGGMNL